MGVEVNFISTSNNFQANGVQAWTWPVGDAGTFQTFSVAPEQANCDSCELTEFSFSRGNAPGNAMVVHLTVKLQWSAPATGGLFTVYGIGAPSN